MKKKNPWIRTAVAFAFALAFFILIRIAPGHEALVEKIYSRGIYKLWAQMVSGVTGLIPVSLTELGLLVGIPLLLVISIVGVWFLLYRTVFGLRARVIGENPEAAGSMGINVYRTQYICVILCGILAAMGGAYMSIGDIHLFSRDMVAGRGFIAMAVVIFGGWHPVGAYLGSLLFGLAQSMQYRLQSGSIPPQLVQMLPYVMTLVVLVFARGSKHRAPAAEGRHYYAKGEQ